MYVKRLNSKKSIEDNPSKLHEVFITIFTNLEAKIKQINGKITHLYNAIDASEWRLNKIEDANNKLRKDIQKFREKIDKQDIDIQNLMTICYFICILLIILIVFLFICF